MMDSFLSLVLIDKRDKDHQGDKLRLYVINPDTETDGDTETTKKTPEKFRNS